MSEQAVSILRIVQGHDIAKARDIRKAVTLLGGRVDYRAYGTWVDDVTLEEYSFSKHGYEPPIISLRRVVIEVDYLGSRRVVRPCVDPTLDPTARPLIFVSITLATRQSYAVV